MPKKLHPASKCSEIKDFWHVRNVPFQTDAGFRFFVFRTLFLAGFRFVEFRTLFLAGFRFFDGFNFLEFRALPGVFYFLGVFAFLVFFGGACFHLWRSQWRGEGS